jgi:RIO-like serine/threonine protein kinase
MSSAERAANVILEIAPEEFRVLQAIELGMASYSYVPLEEILKYAGMLQSEAEFRPGALDMDSTRNRFTSS